MKRILLAIAVSLVCGTVQSDVSVSPAVLDVQEVDGFYVSRRLASVRVGDGGGCSGTIVAVADWKGQPCGFGLTANHCGYEVGSTFAIWFVDGSKANARCIDVDSETDLMLFVVTAKSILGVAPVATEVDEDAFAVGFPSGQGPNEKSLRFRETWVMRESGSGRSLERNKWYVKDGHHAAGDSGGGIFCGDRFVGVLTHGDPTDQDGNHITVQAATHAQVKTFLRRDRGIRHHSCENGQCTEHGPRDLWWLKPNVDIAVPTRPNRNPDRIENPLRLDINRDREQKKAIAELQAQVKLLSARIDALEANGVQIGEPELPIDEPPPAPIGTNQGEIESIVRQVIKGMDLRGPAGPSGKDGKDAPERTIQVEFKWPNGASEKATVPPSKSKVIYTFRTETVERSAVVSK
jgi:hypothetical protein